MPLSTNRMQSLWFMCVLVTGSDCWSDMPWCRVPHGLALASQDGFYVWCRLIPLGQMPVEWFCCRPWLQVTGSFTTLSCSLWCFRNSCYTWEQGISVRPWTVSKTVSLSHETGCRGISQCSNPAHPQTPCAARLPGGPGRHMLLWDTLGIIGAPWRTQSPNWSLSASRGRSCSVVSELRFNLCLWKCSKPTQPSLQLFIKTSKK